MKANGAERTSRANHVGHTASSGKRGHVNGDPGGEALPGCRVAYGMTDLLHNDQENRRPDRYGLHLAGGPPVVTDQQQEERYEADEVYNRKRVGIKDRPAVEAGIQKRERCEPHEPLVHCWLETVAITEIDEGGEKDHVEERNSVESAYLLDRFLARLSHMTS